MKRLIAPAAIALLAACAGPNPAGVPSPSSAPSTAPPVVSPATSAPAAAANELVGQWIGVHECTRIVGALREHGFDESVVIEAVVGNALVPEATSADDLADLANPCADAVPREHGHFFTGTGAFGSTDHHGQQVDDGAYQVVDHDTVRINGTEFGYEITGGSLTLRSLAPEGCTTFECGWSIMVAMAGAPLERVPR